MATKFGKSSRPGRPLRGTAKRVRCSHTLCPNDLAWLEREARARGQSKSELIEKLISLGREEITSMHEKAAVLVRQHPEVYWDVDIKSISGEDHAKFIIERMLEHGTWKGIKDLLLIFRESRIIDVVIHSRRISKKTALFWRSYFRISEQSECLRKELQNPLSKHWS